MEIIRDQNGFTLVELMIALVVGALIIYAVTQFTVLQQQTYLNQEKIQNAQQGVRAAMLFMSNEIRMAGYDPEDDCLPDTNTDAIPDGVSATSSTTLTINTCTTTSPAWTTVTYTRDATDNTITREATSCTVIPCDGSSGGAQPVAEDITSLSFTYYNAAGTAFTPADDQDERDTIRRINISMTATTDNAKARILTSNVGLRNMDMED